MNVDEIVFRAAGLRAKESELLGDKSNDQVAILYAFERITELEAAQRWVSVEDRLPTEPGIYLVYTLYAGTGFYDASHFRIRKSGGRFTGLSARATHWMPLPSPPIERVGGEG